MGDLINPVATEVKPSIDNAALTIYDSLSKEAFSLDDQIAIVKAVSGLIKADIDQNILSLQRLKSTF